MAPPHVLILPYPAQGHVIPLLELSHFLADHGVKVTFVNTDFNHRRMKAEKSAGGLIRMVSFPDGLGPSDDRNDIIKLSAGIQVIFPALLEDLIGGRSRGDDRMTWMIPDFGMTWALPIAKKNGLRIATFLTLSVVSVSLRQSLPKLIHDGILDDDGVPLREEVIRLGPGMPPMNTTEFIWNHIGGDPTNHKAIFRRMLLLADSVSVSPIDMSEFILCNTSTEIEAPALAAVPKAIAIGPLLAGRRVGKPAGSFWEEDVDCMGWLDEQAARSVVYVAFGSYTMFEQRQFQELALGIELTGRPFLWVVRPGMTKGGSFQFPLGFRGRIVGWAPQEKVLSHPCTGCFLSHCGWNSSMEGLMSGVPFLCWPYFGDQFLNRNYICDVWRVGLRVTSDGDTGIISRGQIKEKVEEVLGDEEIRMRALMLKERLDRNISRGGPSYENLSVLVNTIKEGEN